MFQALFLIKLIVAVAVVVGLSILAERVSPKVAGVLSGYPTGSAILLFFYGVEISPEFAARSATYTMTGLTASMSFMYFYYKASKNIHRFNILLSSLIAIPGFLTVIWLLHFISLNKFVSFFIPVIFAFLFIYLFREIDDTMIAKKVILSYKVLFIRAVFAAFIILLISSVPGLVGPEWAGLFSAFPTTAFPLMLIVHFTYGKKHVHTMIKNLPVGMFSLIIYTLSVSIVYPLYGLYWGTLISYALATVYLVGYYKMVKVDR